MLRTESSCSPHLLAALNHKVLQHLGMDFSGPRSGDLLRRLHLLALEQQVSDFDPWLRELAFAAWDRPLLQTLIPAFTVGETYFCRDAEAFDWLASHYLAPLLARRRQAGQRSLRLWSAGCCTGEEAYGLLFLIDQLLGADSDTWAVELVASDINTAFLARAEQGLYGANAFRRNETLFRSRYFEAEGRAWRVRPAWRGRIRFIQYNLADGAHACPIQGADLILCRNVLMYFSAKRATGALQRMLGSLNPEGLLLLSAVEAGLATQAGFNGRWAGSNYALSANALSAGLLGQPLLPLPTIEAPAIAVALPAIVGVSPRVVPAEPDIASHRPVQPAPAVAVTPVRVAQASLPSGAPEQFWQHAQQVLQQGDHSAAREALLAYLACAGLSHAQQHLACLLLARSWADQRRLTEAQDWLQRALVLEPDSAMAYWLAALLAQQSGDNPEALLALQKCLYLDPAFILGYFLQASLLLAQGRIAASDKALQVCQTLLGEQDEDTPVPQGDGMSCGQLQRLCEQLQGGQRACRNR